LIKHCRLVCAAEAGDIVIWKADDEPANGRIDVLELAYLETGGNKIRILEFTSCPSWLADSFRNEPGQISSLQNDHNWWKETFISECSQVGPQLIPQCSNVQFTPDSAPPWSKSVNISFELYENGAARQYQISSALRCWAGHLLDGSGSIVSDDD